MIVVCPACETRYFVDDETLGGELSRRVRCASCGNIWQSSADEAAIHEAIAKATASMTWSATERAPAAVPRALRPEPTTDAQSPPVASAPYRPSVVVAPPAVRRRRRTHVGGLGFLVLAAGIVFVAIYESDRIVAIWPSLAPIYVMLHLADPPGAGLNVTVTLTRNTDLLVIDGDIVNSTAVTRPIPRLRVTLRDTNDIDLEAKVIDPPAVTLLPGATAHFNTTIEHPSNLGTLVAVTFASP